MSLWGAVRRYGIAWGYLLSLLMFGARDAWEIFRVGSAPLWTPFLEALLLQPFTIAVSVVVVAALRALRRGNAGPSSVPSVVGTLVAVLGFAFGGLPLFVLIGILLLVSGALLSGDRAMTDRPRSPWALGALGGFVGGAVGGLLALAAALLVPLLLRIWIPSTPLDGGYGLEAVVVMFHSALVNVVVGAIVGAAMSR
jgi:hypothetical protein